MSLDLIREWHRQELAQAYSHPSPCRLVMGTPVWGEPYLYNFSIYCLPSIMAAANRMVLDSMGWSLVLYVDEEARARLEPRTTSLGIPTQYRMIPPAIMAALHENGQFKYATLAAVHNVLIHEAARIGAGFHMLTADVIYSERYFVGLLYLGVRHQAVPHTGFAVNTWQVLPLLDRFRQFSGTLRIPARDLGQIAADHIITPWRNWELTEDFEAIGIPPAHYLHTHGCDRMHIHTAHQSAAWIGPSMCRNVTSQLGGTVDSEPVRYMGTDFHATTLADEMTYIALGGNGVPEALRWPLSEFRPWFWNFIGNNRDFLPYFAQPCPVPLAVVDHHYPNETALLSRIDRLMQHLETTQ